MKPILVISRNKTSILWQQVVPDAKLSYRKFSIPEDISNLAYFVQKGGSMKDDDWANIHGKIDIWNKKKLVILS